MKHAGKHLSDSQTDGRELFYLTAEDTVNDLRVERAILSLDNRCPEGVNERKRVVEREMEQPKAERR